MEPSSAGSIFDPKDGRVKSNAIRLLSQALEDITVLSKIMFYLLQDGDEIELD